MGAAVGVVNRQQRPVDGILSCHLDRLTRHIESRQQNDMTSTNMNETSRSSRDGLAEMPLFADYARMLIFVNAAFAGTVIAMSFENDMVSFLGCFIAAWVSIHVYFLRWRWFFPCITFCLLYAAMFLTDDVPALHHKSVAFRGLFALLVMTGFSDGNAIIKHLVRTANTEVRAVNVRKFLLRFGLRYLSWTLFAAILVYSVIVPLVQELIFQQNGTLEDPLFQMDRLTLPMNILFRFSESMTAVFMFVVGTCIGSFLNVVIYRVPRRISVLVKPSHCPGCEAKILSKDNLPLLGWLQLNGQCRNCHIQIPIRYPTVELVVGLTFLVLYFVELISGGANLPVRAPNGYAGVLWILFYTKWDLVGFYAYHCTLLCTVFSWGMIGLDANRVPRLTATITLLVFAALQFFFPGLQLLHAVQSEEWLTAPMMVALTCGLGLASGLCAAWIAGILDRILNTNPAINSIPGWLLIGLTLGWQAVIGIFALLYVWRVLSFVHQASVDRDSPYAVNLQRFDLAVSAFLLIHHCVWRPIWLAVTGTT